MGGRWLPAGRGGGPARRVRGSKAGRAARAALGLPWDESVSEYRVHLCVHVRQRRGRRGQLGCRVVAREPGRRSAARTHASQEAAGRQALSHSSMPSSLASGSGHRPAGG